MDSKLRQRRLELGLTLEEVGNIVGVGKSTVRKWETGDIANMRRDKIALLAKALQVSPSFIMGWDDSSSNDKLSDEDIENILTREFIKNGILKEGEDLTKEQYEQAMRVLRAFFEGMR